MCVYIEIEDLVSNALIERSEKGLNPEILFKNLDDYGHSIVEKLKSKQIAAALQISSAKIDRFLNDYSDLFELYSQGFSVGIRLRNVGDTSRLWEKFRRYQSAELIIVSMDDEVCKCIGD